MIAAMLCETSTICINFLSISIRKFHYLKHGRHLTITGHRIMFGLV